MADEHIKDAAENAAIVAVLRELLDRLPRREAENIRDRLRERFERHRDKNPNAEELAQATIDNLDWIFISYPKKRSQNHDT